MSTEIRVPTLGESVTEATVGQWFKQAGEAVSADEPVVELETDKVTIEVPAPSAGVLSEITVAEGDTVEVGALLGAIAEGEGAAAAPPPVAEAPAPAPEPAPTEPAPAAAAAPAEAGDEVLPPSVRKLVAEHDLDTSEINGSGKNGQILKEDVLAAIEAGGQPPQQAKGPAPVTIEAPAPTPSSAPRAPAVRRMTNPAKSESV